MDKTTVRFLGKWVPKLSLYAFMLAGLNVAPQETLGAARECIAAFGTALDKPSCKGGVCARIIQAFASYRQRSAQRRQERDTERQIRTVRPLLEKLEAIREGKHMFGGDLINIKGELLSAPEAQIRDSFVSTIINRRKQASQGAVILKENPHFMEGLLRELAEVAVNPEYSVAQRTNAAMILAQSGRRGEKGTNLFLEKLVEGLQGGEKISVNELYVITELLFFHVSGRVNRPIPREINLGFHSFGHIKEMNVNRPEGTVSVEALNRLSEIDRLIGDKTDLSGIAEINRVYVEFLKITESGKVDLNSQKRTQADVDALSEASRSSHEWLRLNALNALFLAGKHRKSIQIGTQMLRDSSIEVRESALRTIHEILRFGKENPESLTVIKDALIAAGTKEALGSRETSEVAGRWDYVGGFHLKSNKEVLTETTSTLAEIGL